MTPENVTHFLNGLGKVKGMPGMAETLYKNAIAYMREIREATPQLRQLSDKVADRKARLNEIVTTLWNAYSEAERNEYIELGVKAKEAEQNKTEQGA